MLKPIHARMARAALDWSLRDLQEKTGINKNTLARFESGRGVLLSTAVKIEDVFVREGIVFIFEEDARGPGVIFTMTSASPTTSRASVSRKPESGKRSQKS